jgi:hypothetical protein
MEWRGDELSELPIHRNSRLRKSKRIQQQFPEKTLTKFASTRS